MDVHVQCMSVRTLREKIFMFMYNDVHWCTYIYIIRTCICLLDLGFFSLFSQLPVLSVEQLRAAIDSLGHIVEALSVQVCNMYKAHV